MKSDAMREYESALRALRDLRKQEINELALAKLDRHAFDLLCSLDGHEQEDARELAHIAWPPFADEENESPIKEHSLTRSKIVALAWAALTALSLATAVAEAWSLNIATSMLYLAITWVLFTCSKLAFAVLRQRR